MFGNNAVTSTWGNPQNQQQQPAGNSTFGQPSGFGNTAGFGSTTSNFGQPQQQQANPMFGNLSGTNTSNTGTPGFGGFGSGPSGQTSSVFGAPKTTTGFGAFSSGTNTFGSGGAFGQNTSNTGTSGTSLFSQPSTSTTTNAFGSSTSNSIFGNKPATTFGTATAQTDNVAPVTTGTANPPYSVFTDKDTSGNSAVTLQYQAITCMPAYRGTSLEELRLQDYAQGRKTAGAFGQSATFGTSTQPTTSIFGQSAQQNTGQTSIFGGGTTTQPTPGFNAFGQNNQTTQSSGSGLFSGTPFGQQQQQPQQQTGTFGSFGQPAQQQNQSGSLFGSGTTNAFGAKPGGFGTFGTGGTFGSNTSTTGAFGQPAQQQQGTSLFGQTQPTSNAFGSFGTKPIFGTSSTTQPAQTGFGLFGQQNQSNQQQQPQQTSIFGGGGGLFGNNPPQQQQQGTQQQQPTTSLFGNINPTTQPTGGGIFGGGGLFGTNTQQQLQQNQPATSNPFGTNTGTGLFGTKPAAPSTSLFGSFGQPAVQTNTAQPQSGSLFGSTLGQSTNQQSTLGSGLFGKPAAPALGSTPSTGTGTGLFGSLAPSGTFTASTSVPGAQGTLTASISEPIGANLPIFSMLPPGPRSVNLDLQQSKKKPTFFTDVPTRTPVPRVQLGYTPASSKLRGFASSNLNGSGNPFALSLGSGKPGALSLSRIDNKASVGPDSLLGRSSSPSLGSGGRQSVKKLILDKKVEPSDLFTKSTSPGRGGKITFSPALSVAAREKEAAALATSQSKPSESPSPARQPYTPTRLTAETSRNALQSSPNAQSGINLEEGDYWCKPDLTTLKQAGFSQLSAFPDLVVGRKGYGELHFLEPVDLTGLSKLGALLGEVVRFDDKECSVYPDSEDVDKPPPGSGLNVRARIVLERCWATDKATREPIKDEKHPSTIKHLKRLKNMKDTHFEGFDVTDGKWTFTVDHF